MLFLIVILLLAIALTLVPGLRALASFLLLLAGIGLFFAFVDNVYIIGIAILAAVFISWILYKEHMNKFVAAPDVRSTTIREADQKKIRKMISDGSYTTSAYYKLLGPVMTIPPPRVPVYETSEVLGLDDDSLPIFYYLKSGKAVFVAVWADMSITTIQRATKPEELL